MSIKPYKVVLGKLFMLLACAAALPAAQAADSSKPAVVNEGEHRAQYAGQSLIGAPAPYVILKAIDGKQIDLGSYYGKQPVYLKFWATWCIPCREQMPAFERTYQVQGKQIKVIAVNTGFSDNVEAINEYRKKVTMHMPVVIDNGSLAAAFNIRVTPTHVLIDKDGRIAHIGHLEDDKFHAALDKVLAGATAPKETRRSGAKPLQQAVYQRGDVVGELRASTLDGNSVQLADGKPRALIFTAPWCESYLAKSRPAVAQACRRVRLEAEQLSKEGGVSWLLIASGLWANEKDLYEYQTAEKISLPVTLDANSNLFRAFNVRDIPTVVLIDAQNRVTQILGPNDMGLKAAVDELKQQTLKIQSLKQKM
ncbi:Thiol-disulfide oxidoreductase ResA [compost metagenome]